MAVTLQIDVSSQKLKTVVFAEKKRRQGAGGIFLKGFRGHFAWNKGEALKTASLHEKPS